MSIFPPSEQSEGVQATTEKEKMRLCLFKKVIKSLESHKVFFF